jgi:hypothetical protein
MNSSKAILFLGILVLLAVSWGAAAAADADPVLN